MTTMIVSMPFDNFYRNLTKKKMQTKDFKVWDVDWNTASFICKDCGHTIEKDMLTKHDKQIRADAIDEFVEAFKELAVKWFDNSLIRLADITRLAEQLKEKKND